jgi:hypothetical protein
MIAMSNHPLLPIFRLLPSRGLRYVPIRPIGPMPVAPRAVPFARALQRVRTSPVHRDTNQIPS